MKDWTAAVPAAEPRERGQVRPRDEPKGKGKGKEKKVKLTANDGVVRVAATYQGRKVCGAFNGTKGCERNEKWCPQKGVHVCGFIKADGSVCGATDHGARSKFHLRG